MSQQQVLGKWIKSGSPPAAGQKRGRESPEDDQPDATAHAESVKRTHPDPQALSADQLAHAAYAWIQEKNQEALASLKSGGELRAESVRWRQQQQQQQPDALSYGVEALDEGFVMTRAAFDSVAHFILRYLLARSDWETRVQSRYISDAYLNDRIESIHSLEEMRHLQRDCLAVLNTLRSDLIPGVITARTPPASPAPTTAAVEPELLSPGQSTTPVKSAAATAVAALEPEQQQTPDAEHQPDYDMSGAHEDSKRFVRLSPALVQHLRTLTRRPASPAS